MKRIRLRISSLLIALLLAINVFGLEKVKYVATVDGDTIKVEYEGKVQCVRFIGIDTPESKRNKKLIKDSQKSGQNPDKIIEQGLIASDFVKNKLKDKGYVYLEFDKGKNDQYNRLLAYIYADDQEELEYMINYVLLKEGYATIPTYYPNVKYKSIFQKAQEEAKKKRAGFWADNKL
jgi:micrococcal nuclease